MTKKVDSREEKNGSGEALRDGVWSDTALGEKLSQLFDGELDGAEAFSRGDKVVVTDHLITREIRGFHNVRTGVQEWQSSLLAAAPSVDLWPAIAEELGKIDLEARANTAHSVSPVQEIRGRVLERVRSFLSQPLLPTFAQIRVLGGVVTASVCFLALSLFSSTEFSSTERFSTDIPSTDQAKTQTPSFRPSERVSLVHQSPETAEAVRVGEVSRVVHSPFDQQSREVRGEGRETALSPSDARNHALILPVDFAARLQGDLDGEADTGFEAVEVAAREELRLPVPSSRTFVRSVLRHSRGGTRGDFAREGMRSDEVPTVLWVSGR